jgi:hypothetical protein
MGALSMFVEEIGGDVTLFIMFIKVYNHGGSQQKLAFV